MKKIKTLVLTFVFTFMFLNLFRLDANAFSLHDSADNMISIDLVLKERAMIEGDAILLGESISYGGKTNGNIVALANSKINLSANEFRNSFVVAKGDVNINGDGNAIYAFGNTIKYQGNAKRAYLIAKQVNVSGVIDGDLTVIGTQIILDPQLVVNGNLSIESPIEPEYPEGTLQEKVSYTKVDENEKKEGLTSKLLRLTKFLLWLAPTGLITAIIYIKLLGPIKRQGVKMLKKAPLSVFLYGILMLIGLPTVSFIFMVAIIGLPTALIILMIYMICFLIAVPCFGVALGDYIFPKQSEYISGLMGTLIVSLIVALPYIGAIVYFIALLYTYGMFSIIMFNLARREKRTSRRAKNKKKVSLKDIKEKINTKIKNRKNKKNNEEKEVIESKNK